MHDPDTTEADRIQEILNAKYCKADLIQLTQDCKQLSKEVQQKLIIFVKRYEQMFDGSVGTWNTDPVGLTMRDPNCTPCHANHTWYHIFKCESLKRR